MSDRREQETDEILESMATGEPTAPPPMVKRRQRHPKGASTLDTKQKALVLLEQTLEADKSGILPLDKRNTRALSPKAILEAFRQFEDAVGGRKELIEVLKHCPPNTAGHNLVQGLLGDPEFLSLALDGEDSHARVALEVVCRKKRISLGALVQAFRDAKVAKWTIESLTRVEPAVPVITDQVALDAQNRWETCKVCQGSKRIPQIDNGEWAKDEYGNIITHLCYQCRGTGEIYVQHDFANRKLFLEQVGLIRKEDKGPLVNIDQRSVNVGIGGGASFDQIMKNIDKLVRPNLAEVIIDVQPEDNQPVSDSD